MRVWLPASVSPEKKEEDGKTKEDKRTEKKRREKGQKKKRTRGGSAAFIAGVSHKVRIWLGGTKMILPSRITLFGQSQEQWSKYPYF